MTNTLRSLEFKKRQLQRLNECMAAFQAATNAKLAEFLRRREIIVRELLDLEEQEYVKTH